MQTWSNQHFWMLIALVAVAFFIASVVSRIRTLSKRSAEIHKTLDYSKMKKWEDEDDDWGKPDADASESTDRFK